jgi:hypothetical protein
MQETVREEMQKTFNPEFLNRLDDVIVFHPLEKEHIAQIVKILLRVVQRRLGDEVRLTQAALDFLLEKGFDKSYFAYTEDVDLGLRARRAGFRCRCVGAVRVFHTPSSSTGGGYNPRRKYMMAVNSVHFLRTWGGPREKLRFFVYDVLTLPLVLVDGLMRCHTKAAAAKALGLYHGFRGRRVTAETVQPGATCLW